MIFESVEHMERNVTYERKETESPIDKRQRAEKQRSINAYTINRRVLSKRINRTEIQEKPKNHLRKVAKAENQNQMTLKVATSN